jgi:hypothetical protein
MLKINGKQLGNLSKEKFKKIICLQWSILGQSAMWEWNCNPVFQRLSLPVSSTLMMEAQTVFKMLDYSTILTQLIAWEDFTEFSCH